MKKRQRDIFAARLKQALAKKNLKLRNVAEALKVPLSTVGNWTQGRGMPAPDHFERLAKYVGLDPTYLRADDTLAPTGFRELAAIDRFADRFISSSGLVAESNPTVEIATSTGEEITVLLNEAFPGSTVVAWLSRADWEKMKEAYAFLEQRGKKPAQGRVLRACLQMLQLGEKFLEAFDQTEATKDGTRVPRA